MLEYIPVFNIQGETYRLENSLSATSDSLVDAYVQLLSGKKQIWSHILCYLILRSTSSPFCGPSLLSPNSLIKVFLTLLTYQVLQLRQGIVPKELGLG